MKGFGGTVAGIGGLLLVITVLGHFTAVGDYRSADSREWEVFDAELAREIRSWRALQAEAARRVADSGG